MNMIHAKTGNTRNSLRQHPELLEHITDLNRVILDAIVQEQHYNSGSIMFKQGEPANFLHIIVKGVVLVYMQSNGSSHTRSRAQDAEQAPTQLVSFLKPGELLGEIAFIDNSERSATAEAIHDTVTLAMSKEHFKTIRANFPALAFELVVVELAKRVRTGNVHAQVLMKRKPLSRLARFLHDMAQHHGISVDGEDLVDLYVSQSRLERLLGFANTSVSKIMVGLKDEGVIESRPKNRVRICDMPRLEEMANGDE
ncbi:MAG TPA: Crp/Fnr family transcriptional regulator [Kouleothrix sp.]|uniref:Crp/Fnr family transcriptional regulator n=1 Tax=Kouleothrix sp. TaxID=2779161 RepID=UPI002CEFA8D1|nr:Crp/Fnr family transcriptional regulator [Kouleothrix sp.]